MKDTLPDCYSARVRAAVAALGAVCALLGMVVVTGWRLHSIALVRLNPGLAPMQYNTAIGFAFAGLAVCGWAWGRPSRISLLLGGFVALLGIATLGEHALRGSSGIDNLFAFGYVPADGMRIGQMPHGSALCLSLAGMAILWLTPGFFPRWRGAVIGTAASAILSMMAVALIGSALSRPGFFGWATLNILAIHTICGFAALGAGLLLIAWNCTLCPGERTPRWLPAALAAGMLTASLLLFLSLNARRNEDIIATVKAGAESVKHQVAARIGGRLTSITRMARRWEFSGGTPEPAWRADAANYVHDFPDLQALEWIDSSHIIRWIVPLAGNEAKLNRNLTLEANRKAAVERAERDHAPAITPIVTLFRGGLGCVIYVPISVNGRPDGFIAATLKMQHFLDACLPSTVATGEAIEFSQGGRVFYTRDAATPPARARWVAEDMIDMDGSVWTFRMWPTPELAAQLYSPLPVVVLIAGVLGSLLLGASCFFAQRWSREARATTRANLALQGALDTVRTLEGMLPICSCCKRVREDSGYWSQIDSYLSQHTNASLSHGYCPECAARAFKDFGYEVPESVNAEVAAGNFER